MAERAPFARQPVAGYTWRLVDFEKAPKAHILAIQKDPGSTVVYVGFTLLGLTLCAVFFFSHQRVWAMVEGRAEGGYDVIINDVVEDAASAASGANVPVSTIAFGTDTGVVDIRGNLQRVPVDRLSLQQLAETTKGYFYEAASVTELKQVYEDMGSSIGHRVEAREVTQWYAGVALLLGLAAAGMSLLWTSRLP